MHVAHLNVAFVSGTAGICCQRQVGDLFGGFICHFVVAVGIKWPFFDKRGRHSDNCYVSRLWYGGVGGERLEPDKLQMMKTSKTPFSQCL